MVIGDVASDVRFARLPGDPSEARQFSWLSAAEMDADMGPELEKKARFVVSPAHHDERRLAYRPTTWATPARVHAAISERMAAIPRTDRGALPTGTDGADSLAAYDSRIAAQVEAAARIYETWERSFSDGLDVPAFAVVHMIITTCDGQIVQGRRPLTTRYFPGMWAASLEEQIQADELAAPGAINSIVRRGICEEIGLRLAADDIEVKKSMVAVEWPLLNPAILVHVKSRLPAARFIEAHSAIAGIPEIPELSLLPIDDARMLLEHSPVGFVAWQARTYHPTTAVRASLVIDGQR